ncbi:MAG: hypothetical protein E4H01_15765 [Lysobacterales bacterium]|nr:MAG: hypothetical protein E4H01_15765 [Xanthomonadales bacterium]
MNDPEAILATAKTKRPSSKFDRWLHDHPDRQTLYYDTLKLGLQRGIPFAAILRAFVAAFPDSPAVNYQTEKRRVDAYFTANT